MVSSWNAHVQVQMISIKHASYAVYLWAVLLVEGTRGYNPSRNWRNLPEIEGMSQACGSSG